MHSTKRLQQFATLTKIGLLLAFGLLLSACTPTPTPSGGATPAGTSAPAPTTAPVGTGLCSSSHFPVVLGASWTFSGTGPTGEFAWTSSVTDVTDTNFTLTNQYDELVTTQQWACTADGIAALQYGGGPEATLSGTGVSGTFETTDMSGVTFPTQINAGDTWEQSFNIQGDIAIASGTTASTTGAVTQSYVAAGIETVTVPAGTFEAMRVDATITFDLQITISSGITVPLTFASDIVNWWVAGVGWVKSDSTATIEGGDPIVAFTELESFNIP